MQDWPCYTECYTALKVVNRMLLQGKGAMFFHMKMEHIGQYKNMALHYAVG